MYYYTVFRKKHPLAFLKIFLENVSIHTNFVEYVYAEVSILLKSELSLLRNFDVIFMIEMYSLFVPVNDAVFRKKQPLLLCSVFQQIVNRYLTAVNKEIVQLLLISNVIICAQNNCLSLEHNSEVACVTVFIFYHETLYLETCSVTASNEYLFFLSVEYVNFPKHTLKILHKS